MMWLLALKNDCRSAMKINAMNPVLSYYQGGKVASAFHEKREKRFMPQW